jgi:hypothetical protein
MKSIEKVVLVIVLFGLGIASWFGFNQGYRRVDVKDNQGVAIFFDTERFNSSNYNINLYNIDYIDYNSELMLLKSLNDDMGTLVLNLDYVIGWYIFDN